MRHMDTLGRRSSNGQRAQERTYDSRGNLPLFEDHPADSLSLSTESPDTRLQAWERMAIRSFGSRAVDTGAHEGTGRVLKETLH